jgi:ketosteroid isomerase-like protein
MRTTVAALLSLFLLGCSAAPVAPEKIDKALLQQQVTDTERAFAKTMADRDHAAFSGFLSEQAVFFGSHRVLHGKQEVAEARMPLYQQPQAPFSWEPAQVEVLDSGDLALSTGPVRDAQGKQIAIYNSIWRREAPGVWRIVFDKGSEVCK